MWGQLVQQLLDPVFLPRTVDIGDLIFWEAAEKLVHLGGHGGGRRQLRLGVSWDMVSCGGLLVYKTVKVIRRELS
jgi:hypothetical protein